MLAEMPPEPEPPDVWVLLLNPRVPSRSVGWLKRLLDFDPAIIRTSYAEGSRSRGARLPVQWRPEAAVTA